jgi:hypothetical protein
MGGPFEVRAGGKMKHSIEIGGCADVLLGAEIPYPGVTMGVSKTDLIRLIGGTIVGDNEFKILKLLCQNGIKGGFEIIRSVPYRQPYAYEGIHNLQRCVFE